MPASVALCRRSRHRARRYVGCTDGAIEQFDRLLGLAAKYGMKVLIDLHALEGSQNGLDNSGLGLETIWRTKADLPADSEETWQAGEAATGTTFSHWASRKAEWMGKFDLDSKAYSALYWHRLDATLDVVRAIAQAYSTNAAVMGVQPVNEPWQFTPIGPLKRFYWEGCVLGSRTARSSARLCAAAARVARARARVAHGRPWLPRPRPARTPCAPWRGAGTR